MTISMYQVCVIFVFIVFAISIMSFAINLMRYDYRQPTHLTITIISGIMLVVWTFLHSEGKLSPQIDLPVNEYIAWLHTKINETTTTTSSNDTSILTIFLVVYLALFITEIGTNIYDRKER